MADLNIGNSSASVVVNAKHNGSVIPQIDNTYDLGTSALRWKNLNFTTLNTAFIFKNNDMPEGEGNLNTTGKAHSITFYRNGLTIPYQMDNANDGGLIRTRGTSESNTVFEMATWDDYGTGETIQFNYYPTSSQGTPTYSVSVPKKTGTIALLTDKVAGATLADNATKLATARTIQTNLASTTSASFDGSSNITPGVTGILGIGNGGTGANNRKTAITNLGVFGLYDRNDIGTSPNFDNPGVNGFFELRTKTETTGETGTKPYDGFGPFISIKYSNTMFQLAGTNTNGFYIRGKQAAGVTLSGVTWQKLLTNSNYTDYTVTKTGSGASGTWGISISGNAATATKLATARTIRTNLASTSTASFDGSANITPGVTGTLPIANGGTGATTASTARDNLGAQSKVLYGNSAPSDSTGSNGDMYIALESGDFKKDIVNLIYPVGSIYISMNSTNPSTLFGGTWEAFGQGRVLIGAGTGNDGSTSLSFTAGNSGGEYKHTLSVSEMPSHTHTQNRHAHTVGAHSHRLNSHTHSYTKATGVAGHTLTVSEIPAHSHLQYVSANSGGGAIRNDYNSDSRGLPYSQGINTGNTGGGGSHSHGLNTSSANTGAASGSTANSSAFNSGSTTATNQNTGGGSSHNNIQPYIVVYMWKRTA